MSKERENPLLVPCGTKKRTIDTHEKHINVIKSSNAQQIRTLLLGDSLLESINIVSIRYLYPSITTWLNCSVGGDGIQHLLYRMFLSNNNNISTSIASLTNNFKNFDTIVILIGTNNTNKKNYGEKIYEGIINIVDLIKKVNNSSRIIVLAIPPRTQTTRNSKIINSKEAVIITENTIICNSLLAKANDKYEYYDITNDFATVNIGINQFELVKEYFRDDVHFSDEGYKIILERLTSLINK